MKQAASRGRHAAIVVAALMAVSAFNSIDRALIGLLLEPIRSEFGLSDAQARLLVGPPFAISHALFAFVFAA